MLFYDATGHHSMQIMYLVPQWLTYKPCPVIYAICILYRTMCSHQQTSAGIFKQSMLARNRIGIRLSYRPARLAELIPWNRFLGSLKV
jgi:hypothetical protein